MNIFQEEYQVFLKRFEPAFKKTLELYQNELEQIYPKNLFSYFQEFAFRPSKRLRPFLIFLAYRSVGGKNVKDAITVGFAVEILHTALLIQDDVIDRSKTRRGALTLHEFLYQKNHKLTDALHYAGSTAFLISDFGMNIAYHLIHSLRSKEVEKVYFTMLLETVIGEQIDVDLSFHHQYRSKTLLEKVLTLKSGRYSIDRPLSLGLALAGKEKFIPQFLKFSNPLGHVFQVIDDYLGVFGNEKEIGKSADSDLKEGKSTLIVYWSLARATRVEKRKILSVLGNQQATSGEIQIVKGILGKYAEKPVRAYIQRKANLSLRLHEKLPISNYHKHLFGEFIAYLSKRRF